MYHIIIQIAVGLQELAIYDNVWVLIFVIKGVFFIIRLSWRPDTLTSSNHLIKSKRCVLHHPLRWRVWEDRHENCYLWDSSTRGGCWSFCCWWWWWQRRALIILTMVMLLICMLVVMIIMIIMTNDLVMMIFYDAFWYFLCCLILLLPRASLSFLCFAYFSMILLTIFLP